MAAKKPMSLLRKRELRLAAFMLAPAAVVMLLVSLYPTLQSFWVSIHHWDLRDPQSGHPFVGVENYQTILSDPAFWHSVRITAVFVILAVVIEVTLALLIALALNRPFRGRGFVRVLALLPWAIPPVVNGIMWKWILNPSFGAANGLLESLGVIDQYIIWLGEPFRALLLVVFADVWKETPFIMLILLAALQAVPKQLYEAARVDGAGRIRTLFSVTLPLIRPTLFVALSLRTIWALKSFDLIYTLTAGGPSEGTSVLGYYTYLESFVRLRLDQGAAAAYLMAGVVMTVVLLYQRALYKEVVY